MVTQQRVPSGEMEPLRSLAELCQVLTIPKKTVYKWTSNRNTGIPFYRVGKYLRFRFSEIDAWLRKYRASESVREYQLPDSSRVIGKPKKD